MMNRKSLLLLLPILTGCSNSVSNYLYQVQYGYCVDLTETTFPYDLNIDEETTKEVQKDLSFEYPDPLYAHYELLFDSDNLNDYLSRNGSYYTVNEINQNFVMNNDAIFVFQVQIPKGYHAYRRMNVQQYSPSGEILVTPGFYYYSNRPTISYVYIDIIPDETRTENTLYSAVYHITEDFKENLSSTNFRFILSNRQKERKDLWVKEDYEDRTETSHSEPSD